MKAVFVSYNQALTDYGTHAWPSMNSSMLMIVEDEKVAPLLDAFRKLDSQTKMQGSRAFVWNIEQMM